MTTDQVLPFAIVAVVVILIAVGAIRVMTRRRGTNESSFGAGGTPTVTPGTVGVAKTGLAPSGVVHVVGEQWTARSADGSSIASGQPVTVVGQDGLTLIVTAVPPGDRP